MDGTVDGSLAYGYEGGYDVDHPELLDSVALEEGLESVTGRVLVLSARFANPRRASMGDKVEDADGVEDARGCTNVGCTGIEYAVCSLGVLEGTDGWVGTTKGLLG